jgi:hydrogenase-4 component B
MDYYFSFLIISILSLFIIPIIKDKYKSYFAFTITLINILLSSIPAFQALLYSNVEFTISASFPIGEIPLRIDALSSYFILIINFTMLTGSWYGIYYMSKYKDQKNNLSLHFVSFIVLHVSMILVCSIQNSIAFLIVWELMAISSFILVIFETDNAKTLNAGINYLIQSHIGVAFLTIAFILISSNTNSYDFNSIGNFSSALTKSYNTGLFLLFFVGFGIKAGFVPFHTWLPIAHPSAPAHISGIMSGVMIKLGIYGILRVLLLIKGDFLTIGLILLFISIISGLYGVILAIIQHNLKKLLAYHSIENIGIIGIGISIGLIGIGLKNDTLAFLGFLGGLLHIFNHSLFKSLLFFSAGTVYQKTHRLNIDQLGGLIKKLPHTAFLFLIGALAICGLPPFNGFISEFLIYMGLFGSISTLNFNLSIVILTAILSLVLIGGLAIICFTKAFGIVFLGTERQPYETKPVEAGLGMLLPKYLIALLILMIGIFPQMFIRLLFKPLSQFIPNIDLKYAGEIYNNIFSLSQIGLIGLLFIFITIFIYNLKKTITRNRKNSLSPTWGCGYVAPNPKMQYTASSYVRTLTNLAKPLLGFTQKEITIKEIFSKSGEFKTSSYDKIEEKLIITPIKALRTFLDKFGFFQSGSVQSYILYGVIFIIAVLLISYLQSAGIF